jgi:hypothetical protein
MGTASGRSVVEPYLTLTARVVVSPCKQVKLIVSFGRSVRKVLSPSDDIVPVCGAVVVLQKLNGVPSVTVIVPSEIHIIMVSRYRCVPTEFKVIREPWGSCDLG